MKRKKQHILRFTVWRELRTYIKCIANTVGEKYVFVNMHFDIILQHNNDAFFRRNVEQYTVEFIIAPESYSLNKVIRGVCVCVCACVCEWAQCELNAKEIIMSCECLQNQRMVCHLLPISFQIFSHNSCILFSRKNILQITKWLSNVPESAIVGDRLV